MVVLDTESRVDFFDSSSPWGVPVKRKMPDGTILVDVSDLREVQRGGISVDRWPKFQYF